jgi:hypothetical protein
MKTKKRGKVGYKVSAKLEQADRRIRINSIKAELNRACEGRMMSGVCPDIEGTEMELAFWERVMAFEKAQVGTNSREGGHPKP